MSIKNSNDTIGNRTRDLPACSAVPQQTAPPRALLYFNVLQLFLKFKNDYKIVSLGSQRRFASKTHAGH